jgi:hypothetical protein
MLSGTNRLLPRARRTALVVQPAPLEPTPVEFASNLAGTLARAGRSRAAVIARMPPVAAGEYASATVLAAVRRDRAQRRSGFRSRWWFPIAVLLAVICCAWGTLKADQLIAEKLIWPTSGAQFVEVGPRPEDPSATGGPMTIVVAGLNRKSGTGVANALMPSLAVDHTRVVSLVYGSGISDQDILDKFDALMTQYQPSQVSFFGSSMGGDVVLNLAAHTQTVRDQWRQDLLAGSTTTAPGSTVLGDTGRTVAGPAEARPADGVPAAAVSADARRAAGAAGMPAGDADPDAPIGAPAAPRPPPMLGTIYLDCSPLGADDVRDSSRTQADFVTGLTEALDTDGGVAVRLTAEVLAQRDEWSTGEFPFLQVRWDEFRYKVKQVWREKIGAPGISTELIKDQYGVIRRTDIGDVVDALSPGTRIVYFLPEHRHDDRTIRVEQVEQTLRGLAPEHGLDLRVVPIPGGQHASAESNSEVYRAAIDAINRAGT